MRALIPAALLGLSGGLGMLPPPAGAGTPNGSLARGAGPVSVEVPYVTTRAWTEEDGVRKYDGSRGNPRFGHCRVDFSPIPGLNQVSGKLPFYLPSETNRLGSVTREDPESFWHRLQAAVEHSASRSLTLFVHGYNYDFARTCRMAAELRRNLGEGSALVLFSWPANGQPTDYMPDLADVEWSAPFLADFLVQAGARLGRNRVQLVAHSLGARGAILALQRLQGAARPLRQLVLLAPDLDAQSFVELLPRLLGVTAAITLYASDRDAPLKLSHQLSGYPRLGEGGDLLTLAEGVESIDVSDAGRYQILGHEYFFYHPRVAEDLTALLVTGQPAAKRSGLVADSRDGRIFWHVTPPPVP